MKERGILFSGPMVRALLDGSKTQTRRILKGPAWDSVEPSDKYPDEWVPWHNGESYHSLECPYGVGGDRLYVKETWAAPHDCDAVKPTEMPGGTRIHYRATWEGPSGLAWRPSIFLQRRFSRITLEITDVRVERLQDISEEDARAEGVKRRDILGVENYETATSYVSTARRAFEELWDGINGKRAPWLSNPWLWCLSFRRVESKAVAA